MTNQFAIHRKPRGIVLVVVGGIGLGLATVALVEMVNILGYRLPQDDLTTDYAKAVVWALVLGLSILLWPVSLEDKRGLYWAWLAKSLVTLGVMLFYEWNYPLDAHGYFDVSRERGYQWAGFFLGEGTENMTNLCWLLQQIVPNSFHGLKVSFAMLGLVGIYFFYRAVALFLGYADRRVFYLLAFWPSILFWSSHIGKDVLALLGISIYTYGAIGWIHLRKPHFLLILASGAILGMMMRIWLGVIMFAPFAIVFLKGRLSVISKIVLVSAAGIALGISADRLANFFLIETAEELLDKSETLSKGFSAGGSSIEFEGYQTFGGAAAFLPLGVFTALFRPLPGEVPNIFGLLASLENIVALGLLLAAIKRTRWKELGEPVVMWALLLLMAWSTFYAFISSYNLGTASRYRVQILPVMICLLVYLSRRRSSASSFVQGPP